ncbi:MAG: RNA polymerase sigma factor SigJ [Actinomycetes bacterium]
MDDKEWLAVQFERWRPQLRGVAYGMLGSVCEADDAVQESWLRLDRSDTASINDLRGWLTTVVGRICLDMLRARKRRHEDYVGTWLPEPLVASSESDPEGQAVLADSVGLALMVVLDTLGPAERLSFVLHDVFGIAFDEIAEVIDRSPEAARQLATRARRRIQAAPVPDRDLHRQRQVVDAFLVAARTGDMDGLLAVLAPDVVFRADHGAPHTVKPIRGADAVARRVLTTAPRFIHLASPVLVNGQAGALFSDTKAVGVIGFTIVDGLIVAIDLVADPEKLTQVDVPPYGVG